MTDQTPTTADIPRAHQWTASRAATPGRMTCGRCGKAKVSGMSPVCYVETVPAAAQ